MVGVGLDVLRSISGHHGIRFEPCSRMDASQKQPGSVLGSRPFPSDSSTGVCCMEHAVTRTTLAPMAEAGNRSGIDSWCVELCCVVYLQGSASHQLLYTLCAERAGACWRLGLLRIFLF